MVTIRIFVCTAFSALLFVAQGQITARLSTHPLPSPEQVTDLETFVQINPEDLESRVALLRFYADLAPSPSNDAPARRFARLQNILYLIGHHPEAKATGTPIAYVARANGPYANDGDHLMAMHQWLTAIDSHPGDATVLINGVRFLTVEEKNEAENVLQRAIADGPVNPELGANLGFLYATEVLSPEFAAHAASALEETSNPFVLAGAGTAIPNMAMGASRGQQVDPKLFELSSRLLAKARALAPDDKDIQGPMPMINYFTAARDQLQGVVAPPLPSRIRVNGNVESAQLVRKTQPVYPEEARSAGIRGDVRFTAVIGRDGSIQTLELVSGHPLLVPAAQKAVISWLYKPTMLNGSPVEVTTEITVSFPPE
jgi:TonB family protein